MIGRFPSVVAGREIINGVEGIDLDLGCAGVFARVDGAIDGGSAGGGRGVGAAADDEIPVGGFGVRHAYPHDLAFAAGAVVVVIYANGKSDDIAGFRVPERAQGDAELGVVTGVGARC